MRALTSFSLMLFITAGCSTEPDVDIFLAEGTVRGQVTRAGGVPVPDAWVALDGVYPMHNGNQLPVYDSVRTDTAGRYSGTLGVLNMPDTIVTYNMRIWPPAGSGLAPAEILQLGIWVRWPRPDTVVSNIELAP